MRSHSVLLVSLFLAVLAAASPSRSAPPIAVSGAGKGGVPLIAASTSSSWTTAVIELRLAADELSPKQRAAFSAFVAAVADVGAKTLGSSGRVEARVNADGAAIAFGATADQPELALRAADAALRAIKGLKPAAVAPARLDVVDDDLGVDVAAVVLPGTASGLAIDGGVADATAFRAIADTLRADRVAVGVVGPGTPDEVLARAIKVLGAPIAKRGDVVAAVAPEARQLTIETRSDKPTTTLTAWAASPSTPPERAAVIVLAELLGGRVVRGAGFVGISVDVVGANRVALVAAEQQKLENLKKLSSSSPAAPELNAAITAATTKRSSRLDDPTRLAHALARGLVDGSDLVAEHAAIASVSAAAVSAAALRLHNGTVVVRRAAPAGAVVTTTTTTSTTTTTPAAKPAPAGAKR